MRQPHLIFFSFFAPTRNLFFCSPFFVGFGVGVSCKVSAAAGKHPHAHLRRQRHGKAGNGLGQGRTGRSGGGAQDRWHLKGIAFVLVVVAVVGGVSLHSWRCFLCLQKSPPTWLLVAFLSPHARVSDPKGCGWTRLCVEERSGIRRQLQQH